MTPLAAQCPQCSLHCGSPIHRLRLVCNLSMAPPGTPPETEVCPCCSEFWADSHSDRLQRPVPKQQTHHGQYGQPGQNGSGRGLGFESGAGRGRDSAPMPATYNGNQQAPHIVPSFSVPTQPSPYGGPPGSGSTIHHPYDRSSAISSHTSTTASALYPNVANNYNMNISSSSSSSNADYGAALTGIGLHKTNSSKRGSSAPSGRGGRGQMMQTAASNSGAGQSDNLQVSCECGNICPPKTVSKEGPNKGRIFYSCSNQRR